VNGAQEEEEEEEEDGGGKFSLARPVKYTHSKPWRNLFVVVVVSHSKWNKYGENVKDFLESCEVD
jgi:hypothetical protein